MKFNYLNKHIERKINNNSLLRRLILPFLNIVFLCITINANGSNKGSVEINDDSSDTLRLATYNIRGITDEDTGNRAWSVRKAYVAKIINRLYSFDIVGVQELSSYTQRINLMSYLSDYSVYFIGAYDNGIIYKTDRFEIMDKGYFYLSETPDENTIGWDGKFSRNCLWAKFNDNTTEQQFYFFTTHFDHKGDTVRRESAKLTIEKIKEITATDTLPVILVGDFNLSKTSETTAYNTLAYDILSDSKSLVSHRNIEGPTGTANGWDMTSSYDTESNRIDFVFIDSLVTPISHYTIDDKFFDDAYPSDHFPVMITCLLDQTDEADSTSTNNNTDNQNSADSTITTSNFTSDTETSCAFFQNNYLKIKCSEAFDFYVYDLQGNLKIEGQKNIPQEISVNADNLSSGLYLVQIVTRSNKAVLKILK